MASTVLLRDIAQEDQHGMCPLLASVFGTGMIITATYSYCFSISCSYIELLDCYGSDEFIEKFPVMVLRVNLCLISISSATDLMPGQLIYDNVTMLVGNAYHIFMVVQLAWYDMAPLYEEC